MICLFFSQGPAHRSRAVGTLRSIVFSCYLWPARVGAGFGDSKSQYDLAATKPKIDTGLASLNN